MNDPVNVYSSVWFETFMKTIPFEQTLLEVDFLARQLPLGDYSNLLDVCCGTGRHSFELAARGYRVLGVDNNDEAIATAKSRTCANPSFVNLDMRNVGSLRTTYDGIVLLWQSFGYYTGETNSRILLELTELIRPRGRLVLDIYNRDFFERHQGKLVFTKNEEEIVESKYVVGDRLKIDLAYSSSGCRDQFEWEIYTEDQILEKAARIGLDKVLCCTGFSEGTPASSNSPRMQIVLEKN